MMHNTLGRGKSDPICEDSINASFQFADSNTLTSGDIPGYDVMYSYTLHQLVIDCLYINPKKRPGHDWVSQKAKADLEGRKGGWAKFGRVLGIVVALPTTSEFSIGKCQSTRLLRSPKSLQVR